MSWSAPIMARCEPCHGTGRLIRRGIQITCGECGGCGRVHCCEGEQAQPEADAAAQAASAAFGSNPAANALSRQRADNAVRRAKSEIG